MELYELNEQIFKACRLRNSNELTDLAVKWKDEMKDMCFSSLLDWEKTVFRSFQFVDYSLYRQFRLLVLNSILEKVSICEENSIGISLRFFVEHFKKHRPNIGIYAGSFAPFHNGHLNILEKSEKIFDKVIVARGRNPEKKEMEGGKSETLLDLQKIKALKDRQIECFNGFLTDYIAQKEEYANITFIRGLRNGYDLDYEVNQIRFMEDMKPDLKTAFISCNREFEHISSSMIKNLEKISPNSGKKYLPE